MILLKLIHPQPLPRVQAAQGICICICSCVAWSVFEPSVKTPVTTHSSGCPFSYCDKVSLKRNGDGTATVTRQAAAAVLNQPSCILTLVAPLHSSQEFTLNHVLHIPARIEQSFWFWEFAAEFVIVVQTRTHPGKLLGRAMAGSAEEEGVQEELRDWSLGLRTLLVKQRIAVQTLRSGTELTVAFVRVRCLGIGEGCVTQTRV